MNLPVDSLHLPFHSGEIAVQARLGIDGKMLAIGQRVIRGFMPEQHQRFYEQLPMILVGSVDVDGQPWASVLWGTQGFIRALSPTTLYVAARPHGGDPFEAALQSGAALGMLGIELQTRRRNRVNGRVTELVEGGFILSVEQTVGNCAKYIQTRELESSGASLGTPALEKMSALDAEAVGLIADTDTLFIASHVAGAGNASGCDVSHRGGRPGFIVVEGERQLLVPDYAGNGLFMTIGNLQLDARAGLLIIDFASGDLLSIAGRVEVLWDAKEFSHLPGAERAWRFHIDQVVRSRETFPLRWRFGSWSPYLPMDT